MNSWNLDYIATYGRTLDLQSLWRYRSVLVKERRNGVSYTQEITLRLRRPSGTSVTLRPSSNDAYTFREIFIDEVYLAALQRVSPLRTIIDLGANIGLASLYFSAARPDVRSFCVEPEPANMMLLQRNMASWMHKRACRTLLGAVWSRGGNLTLEPLEEGHVNQLVCREAGPTDDDQRSVSGFSMPDILEHAAFDYVDLLKIDVEGAESEAFSGALDWLKRVGAIAIEFHGDSRRTCDFDQKVSAYGFTIIDTDAHTVLARRTIS
jgi:FkbM family methyltransferase